MQNRKKESIQRLVDAFGFSCKGLAAAWKNEQAFRQEIIACVLLFPLAIWIGDDGVERALLLATVLLVLVVELINSAIESVVDRLGDEYHLLSGRAKDMGSAAVLLSLLLGFVVWVAILVQ
jgi:diacylglycerol kinase (ATP)